MRLIFTSCGPNRSSVPSLVFSAPGPLGTPFDPVHSGVLALWIARAEGALRTHAAAVLAVAPLAVAVVTSGRRRSGYRRWA